MEKHLPDPLRSERARARARARAREGAKEGGMEGGRDPGHDERRNSEVSPALRNGSNEKL